MPKSFLVAAPPVLAVQLYTATMALHRQALHGAPCAMHAPRPHLQSAAFAGRPLPARRQRAHRQRVRAVAQTQAVVAKPSPAPAAPPKPAAKRSSGAADLTPEVASDLYRDMFLGREFEEKCAEMYYRGARPIFVARCAAHCPGLSLTAGRLVQARCSASCTCTRARRR